MKQSTIKIISDLIARYPVLGPVENEVTRSVHAIIDCYKQGKKVMTCGNGGSAADAMHIVGELMKSFALKRKLPEQDKHKLALVSDDADYIYNNLEYAFPAISLVNEVSLITAYSNDAAPDLGFAQQVYGYGSSGDILIAISTSGNSKNIIYAAQVAKIKGVTVIALTGENGGGLKSKTDICIAVPHTVTYAVQELHLPVYHAICLAVENEFFGA